MGSILKHGVPNNITYGQLYVLNDIQLQNLSTSLKNLAQFDRTEKTVPKDEQPSTIIK